MTKGLIVISSFAIALMVVSQLVLGMHPDVKEFLDSFSSTKDYLNSLPEYRDHPLTQFREFWVSHYKVLRSIFVVSILVLILSCTKYFMTSSNNNA